MGKQRAHIPSRFDRVKKALDHYLPDFYIIYKKQATSYDALGFPTVDNVPLAYTTDNGIEITEIPCRLQENRTLREGFKNLGQSTNLDYYEIVTYSDAPLLVNHKVTIKGVDFEIVSVNYPTEYSPYKSAFLIHLGKPS